MSTLAGTIISFDHSRGVGLVQLDGGIDAVPFQECDLANRSPSHARLIGRAVTFQLIHNGSSYQAVRVAIIPWWRSSPRDWLAIGATPPLIWGFLWFGARELGWPQSTSYLVIVNFLGACFVRFLTRQMYDRRIRPTHFAALVLAIAGGATGAFFALLFDRQRRCSAKFRLALIFFALIQVTWLANEWYPIFSWRLSLREIGERAFFSSVRIK